MSRASSMVGSNTPATSITVNLATSPQPHVHVADYGDAILVTLSQPSTTVAIHLKATAATELARALAQSLGLESLTSNEEKRD